MSDIQPGTAPRRRPFAMRKLGRLASLAGLLLTLPGCQSVTGRPSAAQLRIIDTSPDAPALDIYQANANLAYDLEQGFKTSYISITPGSYTIAADSAGTRQQVVAARGTFLAEAQYTVLISNYMNSLQASILKDQNTASPAGQVNLRFIHQSVRGGPLDLYLVPMGQTIAAQKPLVANVSFNTNTGYYSLPAATYTLVALPTGTVPATNELTSCTGPAVTYAAGSAQTIVVIDQQHTANTGVQLPGVQLISATDYDPPTS